MKDTDTHGNRAGRRMGWLILFLVIGAVVLVALWMRNPPSNVEPLVGDAPATPATVAPK